MKKFILILSLFPFFLSAQNYIHVQIFNKFAIDELGNNVVVIKPTQYDALSRSQIGDTIVVSGHTHDSYWQRQYGILEKEFWFLDFILSRRLNGGPPIIEFSEEKMFFLHGKIVKIE